MMGDLSVAVIALLVTALVTQSALPLVFLFILVIVVALGDLM
jgi:hypothetical protein